MVQLVWFRNNLRIHDNTVLRAASENGPVICFYCFDERHFLKNRYGFLKTGEIRTQFLIESVSDLKHNLAERGGDLIVSAGKPEVEIPKLLNKYPVSRIFAPKEVTSEEIHVEKSLEKNSAVPVTWIWDSTLYHLNDLPFEADAIPDVFTSFRKKIEKQVELRKQADYENKLVFARIQNAGKIPACEDLVMENAKIDKRSVLQFKGGERSGLKRLSEYIWEGNHLKNYKKTRNQLLGADYSSKFSAWLANGSLSPRKVYDEVKAYENEREKNSSTYWLIFELMWRDYFRFSALKHGNKIFKPGGIQEKKMNPQANIYLFEAWAKGETGIPFIDANMRELNSTGYMSNRGRQNAASFLSQDLNIDWRMGASWFEEKLIDYDVCSNWGNWAYNATVGLDPRNRRFNVILQGKKYDKKGEYIRHWVPELKLVPSEFIHEPWKMTPDQQVLFGMEIDKTYPGPVISL